MNKKYNIVTITVQMLIKRLIFVFHVKKCVETLYLSSLHTETKTESL